MSASQSLMEQEIEHRGGSSRKKIVKYFRLIYLNGKLNFNVSTRFITEVRYEHLHNSVFQVNWTPRNNLTIGGSETPLYKHNLKGQITDVQVWGRTLKEEEMIDYTACTGKGLRGDIASWEEEEWWQVKGKVTSTQLRYLPRRPGKSPTSKKVK